MYIHTYILSRKLKIVKQWNFKTTEMYIWALIIQMYINSFLFWHDFMYLLILSYMSNAVLYFF